jgi:hypothetical protein
MVPTRVVLVVAMQRVLVVPPQLVNQRGQTRGVRRRFEQRARTIIHHCPILPLSTL